jgi:CHAT domain-containing protein
VAKLRSTVEFGDGRVAQLPAFDLERAHSIYRLLLAPDETLWANARTLNIIPHGALGQLPFSLLITEAPSIQSGRSEHVQYRDAAWLLRKIAVAQLPSANAFLALRRAVAAKSGREPLVGFGNPLFSNDAPVETARDEVRALKVTKLADDIDEHLRASAQGDKVSKEVTVRGALPTLAAAFNQLSPLPDTAVELEEIASALQSDYAKSIYTGRFATEGTVKRLRLDNQRVVVFATHGIAAGDLTGLDQPALVLSNPALTGEKGEDGFLTMEEVLALKLDADWVVLSACNTAGADGKGSEAVSGLGRAFFYAGARSLLVSNWAVETTSARLLTTELFKRQAADPNLTRAEALRQAMLLLMAKDSVETMDGRPGRSYAHPAFWAPFALVGDGGAVRAAH